MSQQNTAAIIYLHFCTVCEIQNSGNATMFKIWSDDKLREVYAANDFLRAVSAGDNNFAN